MLSHSNGKVLGNTKRHCKVYRREQEFYQLFPNQDERLQYDEKSIDNLLSLQNKERHYIELYRIRNQEVKDFFKKHAPKSLFTCELDDPLKWTKLAAFMNIIIPNNFEVHENKRKE